MFKKIFMSILIIILFLGICPTELSAYNNEIKAGKITIDTVSAKPGDNVEIPIRIEENPGISALTVSITYDSSVLTYNGYKKGKIINSYNFNAIPEKKIIRYVAYIEKEKDISKSNGVLVTLKFSVNEKAYADLYKIGIKYSSGDFASWDLDKIMPTIISGGVNVEYTGNNCRHDTFDNWETEIKADCENTGKQTAICTVCKQKETFITGPLGHEYSQNWIVDKEATQTAQGEMSRHCIRCDKKVDIVYFSLEQADDGDIKNEVDEEIPNKDYVEDIFNEQNPNTPLTPNGLPENPVIPDNNIPSNKDNQVENNVHSNTTDTFNPSDDIKESSDKEDKPNTETEDDKEDTIKEGNKKDNKITFDTLVKNFIENFSTPKNIIKTMICIFVKIATSLFTLYSPVTVILFIVGLFI